MPPSELVFAGFVFAAGLAFIGLTHPDSGTATAVFGLVGAVFGSLFRGMLPTKPQ